MFSVDRSVDIECFKEIILKGWGCYILFRSSRILLCINENVSIISDKSNMDCKHHINI